MIKINFKRILKLILKFKCEKVPFKQFIYITYFLYIKKDILKSNHDVPKLL